MVVAVREMAAVAAVMATEVTAAAQALAMEAAVAAAAVPVTTMEAATEEMAARDLEAMTEVVGRAMTMEARHPVLDLACLTAHPLVPGLDQTEGLRLQQIPSMVGRALAVRRCRVQELDLRARGRLVQVGAREERH